ncbi:iron chelate uptake ABC transporter family permease subunit [Lentzea sp. NBRC 102530]|uniref:FecCD family ABC transporter permease n=1 Tax=Lentzea sp. NBRC 102530 TaxID=3032201 RepID=UPI0024A3D975|nr:iron chelate uptake ABC transporter family permease subunit [Lentzea sp. NBRC 102530]GLY47011.1 iron ABC transporter [Lentzea sp. NBRC 102530]
MIDEAPALHRGVRVGGWSWVWRPWIVLVTVALAALTFLVFCISIAVGDFTIELPAVFRTLIGQGERVDEFVIMDLRLPRSLIGLIVGAALGISGALTQSIARNALASPDVLGITGGASATAVFVVTAGGGAALGGAIGLPAAALTGGLLTGFLVYFLAWKKGIDGFRLILIGVSVNAVMQALTTWLLVLADIRDVARAQVWLVGSLDSRSWPQVWSSLWITLALVLVVLVTSFQMQPMHFGDDVAAGLGVRYSAVRAVLLLCAVLLAGVAVSAAGPVPFVALVAPQITMRLLRSPVPPLIASGLFGSLLLLGSDLIARVVLPYELPVGIVTAIIGGPFLVYLLVRANTKRAV